MRQSDPGMPVVRGAQMLESASSNMPIRLSRAEPASRHRCTDVQLMPIRLTQTPTTSCVRRDQSSDSGRLRLQSVAHLLSPDRSVLSCLHACARVPPHISSTQSRTSETSQCATRRPRAITSPACTWTARWPDLNDDRPCLDIVGVCVNRIGTD
jgi:hypothetical protein